MSSRAHSAARPVAFGAAAALLAALSVVQAAPAARAHEVTLRGMDLPVPATDVSESDTNLGSTDREVVVLTAGNDRPEVTKLRARTDAEARTLAERLDALPGVTAGPNTTFSLPEDATAAKGTRRHSYATGEAGPSDRVEPKALRISDEQYGAQQWGLSWVGSEPAWTVTRGKGVTVAVIDTGVDRTHPDLAGRTLAQVDLVGDGLVGDPEGHGTHVAGIIGANLDGAGVVGLANQATILPIRVLDETGSGDGYTVAQGIYAAINRHAKVLNMSLGSDSNDPVIAKAVADAVRRGITVVAAGGNEYGQGNPVEYPAAYPGVIAVSSLGADGFPSEFANTGSYIDLIAPGEDILSTYPGGFAWGTGTSMAAPLVSASAALLRAANPALSATAVTSTLQTTAQDDQAGDGWDSEGGYGLVRADRAAVKAAKAPGGMLARVGVKVGRNAAKSKLLVNVDPNKGSGYWTFKVQKRNANGTWKTRTKTYRTLGSGETRTVNLKKGTYRIVVAGKYGYKGATSAPVRLVK